MKIFRNRCSWLVTIFAGLLSFPLTVSAQTLDEEPIMVIKTRIYEVSNGSGVITLTLGATEDGYIDVDAGLGPMEYEITRATLDSETGTFAGTAITCNVTKEGTVKIYGDASKIDLLSASECYITEVQIDRLSNLEILDLSNNELTGLDLSPLHALQYISVSNNPFNVTPLLIGPDKPNLAILDMGRMDNLDQSFNLSDYPALMSFDAWANAGLTSLDPTGCPELRQISVDSTPVESLDLSNNTKLNILNISDSRIRNIDLSHNPYLNQLYCDHESGSLNTEYRLEKLDLTNNPNLVYLFASGNGFTELDVTKNIYLTDLYVNNNHLTSIDLSNNTALFKLSIYNNDFTFATLPLPNENWSYYAYKQNEMPVAKSQKVGTVIDFSDKVLREGTVTTATLYRTSEANPNSLIALDSNYYTYADGKVTLLKAVADSVYLAFSNDAFPESAAGFYPLRTNKFKVKNEADYGADDKVITFKAPVMSSDGTPVEFGIGMYGATETAPKKFYVDYGRGKVEYTATSEAAPAVYNVTGGVTNSGTVTVYVPEGELVSAFDMENVTLNSIDFSAARSLRTLRLVNSGIYGSDNIDLGWNRLLKSLVLTGNHFPSLSIRGVNDAYQKNMLFDIDLSNNEMTSVTLNDMRTIRNLDLSDNRLTELSLKDADNMLTLNVSDNSLETVNVNYCTLMTSLNIARNNVTSIVLPAEISLKELHCESNALNFNTLPVIDGLETYTYAPQNDITIAKIGPGCNLSMYNVDGAPTSFEWKKSGGSPLRRGIDYNEENGVVHFLSPIVGQNVYCEMTNPRFEGLLLRTTEIEAAEMPTNVVASFVTTATQAGEIILRAVEESTPVYIDWSGTQAELKEYIVGTSPVSYSETSAQGATVRVYSYDADCGLDVFSVAGISLSSIDASKLNRLVLFGATNAGLTEDKVTWPDAPGIIELRLAGNMFSDLDLTRYPLLYDLDLGNNRLTSFDASAYPGLELLSLPGNQLTSFNADNSRLWHLDLTGNLLSDIDLSRLPAMNQISLSHNRLSSIDLSAMKALNVIYLDNNMFRPSALPLNNYTLYTYANQAPIEVEVVDGAVDLSSEAVINGKETVYRWFVDMPTLDAEGNLVGEELYIDDEYTLDNGVTSFISPIDNVVCILYNSEFPNAYFYTDLIDIKSVGGVDGITLDGDSDVKVTVTGNDVTVNASAALPVRLVGINGTLLRTDATDADGNCTLRNIAPGAYVVTVGRKAYKLIIK
ncbi:MAG: hypothetical protein K2L55_07565 [Muribaculaceae bacterium]|nr:hypothetical protein [Muribaculaceae bacterium]